MVGMAEPQRGDVVASELLADGRVKIRLAGHHYDYVVRVVSDKRGPRLTELTVLADPGEAVDYAAIRAVPVRRLAHSARQRVAAGERPFVIAGDASGASGQRPESARGRRQRQLAELPGLIEQAIVDGVAVRPTVAQQLRVSLRTLDRMIADARAEGLLDGVEISRRPSPHQRDLVTARVIAERWLDGHGPEADVPPDLVAELDRLRCAETRGRGKK